MSSLLEIDPWRLLLSGKPDVYRAAPAGLKRTANLAYIYVSNSTDPNGFGMYGDYGGKAPARTEVRTVGDNAHIICCSWDEADVAGQSGDRMRILGGGSPNGYYLVWFSQDTKQDGVLDRFVFYGATVDEETYELSPANGNGFSGADGQLKVVGWVHPGTYRREFTNDAAFTEHENNQWQGGTNPAQADFGSASSTDALDTFVLTQLDSLAAQKTLVFGLEFAKEVAAGLVVVAVNTDNALRPDQIVGQNPQTGEEEDNRATVYVPNGTGVNVTALELDGNEQGNTTPDGEGNVSLEYIAGVDGENDQLRFEVSLDATPNDLMYADATYDIELVDPVGGNVTHTVDVKPPVGHSTVVLSGYTEGGDNPGLPDMFNQAGSAAFWGFSAEACTDGDVVDWDTSSTKGYSVDIGANGRPIIGGGVIEEQEVYFRVYRAGEWQPYVYALVNHVAVIESVGGIAGNSGIIDLAATDLEVLGYGFGLSVDNVKVYLMPGKNATLNTDIAVLQNPLGTELTEFGERRFLLSALISGGVIIGGTYGTLHFVPGQSP